MEHLWIISSEDLLGKESFTGKRRERKKSLLACWWFYLQEKKEEAFNYSIWWWSWWVNFSDCINVSPDSWFYWPPPPTDLSLCWCIEHRWTALGSGREIYIRWPCFRRWDNIADLLNKEILGNKLSDLNLWIVQTLCVCLCVSEWWYKNNPVFRNPCFLSMISSV